MPLRAQAFHTTDEGAVIARRRSCDVVALCHIAHDCACGAVLEHTSAIANASDKYVDVSWRLDG